MLFVFFAFIVSTQSCQYHHQPDSAIRSIAGFDFQENKHRGKKHLSVSIVKSDANSEAHSSIKGSAKELA